MTAFCWNYRRPGLPTILHYKSSSDILEANGERVTTVHRASTLMITDLQSETTRLITATFGNYCRKSLTSDLWPYCLFVSGH